jgi:hypothetical protein
MLLSREVVDPRVTLVLSLPVALVLLPLGLAAALRAVASPTFVGGKGLLVLSIFMGYSLFTGSIATYIGTYFRNFNWVAFYTPT